MASSQTLQTNIVINARIGNGFSEVGNTIAELGSIVDGASQALIGFGTDSLNVYKDYEKSMTEAMGVYAETYGQDSAQLMKVMDSLDAAATEWAANTIFHTNDVANAIDLAAHAGWAYEDVLEGMPSVMQLAQAGSIDLSTAVGYVTTAAKAAGIEFEDIPGFIDDWAYAANNTRTDIDKMGQSMDRMGYSMRLAGSQEDLLTMLGVLGDAGTMGSDAGTLLRNIMIRLVAPTDKAAEAMESFGVEASELEEILGDDAYSGAYAQLLESGFSAYDENTGKLKNMTQIFSELNACLAQFESEEERNGILKSIFPTRTFAGALALLEAANDDWGGLYDTLSSDEPEGYAQYLQTLMGETLYGQMELFESKVERLKQLVGEELADEIESGLTGLGEIVDSIAGMDDNGMLGALVSGAEVLATAGPGLMIAAGAFRIIGTLLSSKAALFGMGAIFLASIMKTLHEMETIELENQFGTGRLDHGAISGYLESLTESFDGAYEKVDAFRQAVDESITSYNTASQTFTGDLFTAMLTESELSEEDKQKFGNLALEMRSAVLDGLNADNNAANEFWAAFFGTTEEGSEEDTALQSVLSTTNAAYTQAVAQAEAIGEGLREAMNAAFADGHISEEEYQNILSYVSSYNEAIAAAQKEVQSREDRIAAAALLRRGQNASLDEIISVGNEIQESRDAAIARTDEEYYHAYGEYMVAAEDEIARWTEIRDNATNVHTASHAQAQIDRIQAELPVNMGILEKQHAQNIAEAVQPWNDALFALWDSEISQSGLSDSYSTLNDLATEVLAGRLVPEQAVQMFEDAVDVMDRSDLTNVLTRWMDNMGGIDTVGSLISEYMEMGNTGDANHFMQALAMQQIAGGLRDWNISDFNGSILQFPFGDNWMTMGSSTANDFSELVSQVAPSTYSVEDAQRTLDLLGEGNSVAGFIETLGDITSSIDAFGAELSASELDSLMGQIQSGLTQLSNDNLVMPGDKTGIYDQLDQMLTGIFSNYDVNRVVADVFGSTGLDFGEYGKYLGAYQLITGGINPEDYESESIDLTINPDTEELEATMELYDGQHIETVVDPDTNELHAAIMDEDGNILTEFVLGDITDLVRQINSQDGRHIRIYTDSISTAKEYAEGGRATTASIFGEAGPEWAIPEEHSERTAQLLDSARKASGFTWSEILARTGGLNANANNQPTTLVFSPTINAIDATGVDQALRMSEERLIKLLEERQIIDSLEVYA